MADVKIRDLSGAAALASTDIIEVTVDPSGTPASKKATIAQVRDAVLPTGTNGGVMAYASSAWGSTAAGTARQVLTSGGTGAPAWDVDVQPLTQRALDAASSAVSVCATLTHQSSSAGSAGIGARCLLRASNAASNIVDTAAIDGILTTATGGAEVGALDLYVRSGALVRFARFTPGGNVLGVTGTVTQYQGGARVPETTLVTASGGSTFTLDASHEVVFFDTTLGPATVNLPAGAAGRFFAIQRVAGSNNIIVQRAGSDTIRANSTNGLTSWTISDDACHGLKFRSAANQWVAEV